MKPPVTNFKTSPLQFLKGLLSGALFFLNTIFWCFLLYFFLIFKILIPFRGSREFFTGILVTIAELWIACNSWNIRFTQNMEFKVELPPQLNYEKSYLVCANHQSWVDIVILQHVFNRRIPFLRFFLKQELIYIPLLGGAWWGLDYPFMKRHSKEYLEKHPEKRGEDLKTTQRATEKFRDSKVSILNFLEGTRFTPKKHQMQNSPYHHLLLPKAGGFAFVLEAMKDKFHSVLDVTIAYPQGVVTFWQALCGHLDEVVVHVREIPLPSEILHGNYLEDPVHREKVQNWVRKLWEEKDLRIRQISQRSSQ